MEPLDKIPDSAKTSFARRTFEWKDFSYAALASSHLPDEQKTRVRIPLGGKVYRGHSNAIVKIDLICIACVIYNEKMAPKKYF
jgi:hypothetical protein